MKIEEKQKSEVINKLSSFFNSSCPICSASEWILNDTVFELREFSGGGLIIGGASSSIYPVIAVACKSCGHTHYFSALLLGLIKK
ncbi:MAG: hypothetical protein WC456_04115 [Patescibacteria group bacterium]